MTERLYLIDSHLFENQCTVLSCEPAKEGFDVMVDSTVFFPNKGGQPCDTGILGGVKVVDGRESGDELILGEELDSRVRRLMAFGLRGLECFYSGFTPRMLKETLTLAEQYDLLITAGSDYHGANKLVTLGDTKLDQVRELPAGLRRFLAETAAL